MNLIFRRCLVTFACAMSMLPVEAAGSDFPKWLGGKPDVDIKEDRCGVYEWFFSQADLQTEGIASKNQLASMRVINIANKLVEHHRADPAESYSAEVRFLVIYNDRGPFHFQFQISNSELERIMKDRCGE